MYFFSGCQGMYTSGNVASLYHWVMAIQFKMKSIVEQMSKTTLELV